MKTKLALIVCLTLVGTQLAYAQNLPETQRWKQHLTRANQGTSQVRACLARYHKPVKRTNQILNLVQKTAKTLGLVDKKMRTTITVLTPLQYAPKVGPAVQKVVKALKTVHKPIATANSKVQSLNRALNPLRKVVKPTNKYMGHANKLLKRVEKTLKLAHATLVRVEKCLRSLPPSQQRTHGPRLERVARSQNGLYPPYHRATNELQKPCKLNLVNFPTFHNPFRAIDGINLSLERLAGYFKRLDPMFGPLERTLNTRIIVPPHLQHLMTAGQMPARYKRQLRQWNAQIRGLRNGINKKRKQLKAIKRMRGSISFVRKCIRRPSRCLKVYSKSKLRGCVKKWERCKRRLKSKANNRLKDIRKYTGQIRHLQNAINNLKKRYTPVYTVRQIIHNSTSNVARVTNYLKQQAGKLLGKTMSYLNIPVPTFGFVAKLQRLTQHAFSPIQPHTGQLTKLNNLFAANIPPLSRLGQLPSIPSIPCTGGGSTNNARKPIAVLYEHYSFRGRSYPFYGNNTQLRGAWNDKVSSIKLMRGTVTVYQHFNFGGNALVIRRSTNLPRGWNDQISSIRQGTHARPQRPSLRNIGRYVGCFRDRSQRMLPKFIGNGYTPQRCMQTCRSLHMRYAGLQWKSQCFCGNSLRNHDRRNDRECNTPCTLARNIRCGGAWRNSVYRAR